MSFKNKDTQMEIYFHLEEIINKEKEYTIPLCFSCATKIVIRPYYEGEMAITATKYKIDCSKCGEQIQ